MSMTVEKAIEEVRFNMSHIGLGARAARRVKEAKEMSIAALEEIQQYRAIGTEEEFRELKEKATAKKVIKLEGNGYYDYKCPICGFPGLNCLKMDYCKCGQKLDYSEEKE